MKRGDKEILNDLVNAAIELRNLAMEGTIQLQEKDWHFITSTIVSLELVALKEALRGYK
jgi:hypothetical protein